jgi:site-specific DNA-methyltransferase (cytosine-N4-specific)
LDPFAGSNTTGAVAEKLKRRWLAVEIEEKYVEGGKFRFWPIISEGRKAEDGQIDEKLKQTVFPCI